MEILSEFYALPGFAYPDFIIDGCTRGDQRINPGSYLFVADQTLRLAGNTNKG